MPDVRVPEGLDLPVPVLGVVDVERLRGVVRRVGVDPRADRGGEHERLEGRAGLAMPLGGEVEVALGVGPARRHRADLPVGGVDGHDGRAGPARVGVVGVDRLARLVLHLRVDRRVDPQASAAHDADAVALDQLLLHVVEEVRLTALDVARAVLEPEPPLRRPGRLLLRDVPVGRHLLQHLVAALERGLRVAERVVLGRRLREPCEERRLVEPEVLGVLVEERHRRGLDADRGAAADRPVGHRVQVVVEHPGLRVLLLELGGELGLADLAGEVALRVLDVERAHQLLRDRRAALHRLAGLEVLDPGSDDCVEVHAAVLVEALVLDGDGGAAQVDRDVAPGHDAAQHVGLDEAEPRAVGGVDDRELALVGRLQLGQVRRGRRDRQHVADRRQDPDHDHRREHAEAEQDRAARGVAPPSSCFSLPLGHGKAFGGEPRSGLG